jgi:hypothetical protein
LDLNVKFLAGALDPLVSSCPHPLYLVAKILAEALGLLVDRTSSTCLRNQSVMVPSNLACTDLKALIVALTPSWPEIIAAPIYSWPALISVR